MAHHIETHAGQAAAIFARQDAWHRLGTTVAGQAFTAEDAMRLGHLGGWNVRKAPLTATEIDEHGVTTLPAPAFATVRTSPFTKRPEVLGVVGKGYHPLQNEAHCEFLNRLADTSGAVFDTAGSLLGGRQVFVTMRMPEALVIGGTDQVNLNIAALNSHDGSSAFRLVVTPVRVVCANTQAAALRRHVSSWSIRHTKNAKSAVQEARDALGLTFAYAAEFQEEANRLIERDMNDAQFRDLIRATFGADPDNAPARARQTAEDRANTLQGLFHDAETQKNIRGTAWAGYQSVVEYVDHYTPVRSGGDQGDARAQRVLTSDAPNRVKRTAWEALTSA